MCQVRTCPSNMSLFFSIQRTHQVTAVSYTQYIVDPFTQQAFEHSYKMFHCEYTAQYNKRDSGFRDPAVEGAFQRGVGRGHCSDDKQLSFSAPLTYGGWLGFK